MTKQYVVTDPCYILPDDTWNECIEKAGENDAGWCDRFDEQVQAALSAFVGSKAWAERTGFGDWSNVLYGPNIKHDQFCADSGMFSVCEFNDKVKEALKDCPEHCYAVFETDGDISVEFDDSVSDWHVAEIKSSNGDCWNTEVQSDTDEDEEW